jgi:hypothetical protein
MSPYSDSLSPLTVLGVADIMASRRFLSMRARALARSEDSRDSLASEADAGSDEDDWDLFLIAGRCFEDEDEDDLSCWLMDVRGSWADLRCMSRFLQRSVRFTVQQPAEYNAYIRSSSLGFSLCLSLEEYQGFKSFSDGARGMPLSVSSVADFFVALNEAATAFYDCVQTFAKDGALQTSYLL